MQNPKVARLHQTAVEAVSKVKAIAENHENAEAANPTFTENFAGAVFRLTSSWLAIFLFAVFVTLWVIFNVLAPVNYRFDPFPFLLMTFLLAGIAAVQAPVIMLGQYWQNQKNSKRIAENLKVENQILSLHQSITVLIEQQLQQVHENQLTTIKLLQELHQKAAPPGDKP